MVADAVPRLEAIYLYPTGDCNQRCRHCWVEAAHVSRPRSEEPLGAEDLRRALAPARALGLSWVKVTGGEPFVRPDTVPLMRALAAEGLALDVETNATLIDDRLADDLAGIGVRQVATSLDGATAATHDALRGQPGAFARTVQAIRRLRAREVSVQVLCTLTRASAPEVDALLDLCVELDVDSFKLNCLVPMGRGRVLHEAGLAVPVRGLLAIARHVEEERGPDLPFEVATSLPLAFASRRALREGRGHRCPILSILGVLADGRISLCGVGYVTPELILGDLRRDAIADVWRTSPVLRDLRAALHRRLRGVCGRCILRGACLGACRADAFARSGDLWGEDWLCAAAEREGVFPRHRLEPA